MLLPALGKLIVIACNADVGPNATVVVKSALMRRVVLAHLPTLVVITWTTPK